MCCVSGVRSIRVRLGTRQVPNLPGVQCRRALALDWLISVLATEQDALVTVEQERRGVVGFVELTRLV
jgi:hypothetical protein